MMMLKTNSILSQASLRYFRNYHGIGRKTINNWKNQGLLILRNLSLSSSAENNNNHNNITTSTSQNPKSIPLTSPINYREELLELLQLKTFTEEEWKRSFQTLQIPPPPPPPPPFTTQTTETTTTTTTTTTHLHHLHTLQESQSPLQLQQPLTRPAPDRIQLRSSLTRLYQRQLPLLPIDEQKINFLVKDILRKKNRKNSFTLFPSRSSSSSSSSSSAGAVSAAAVKEDEAASLSAVHHEERMITYEEYKQYMTSYAERLDKRVWNIGLSFLFTGVSVGIIIPCMPLLVTQLQISPSSFGLVISAFGISKLLGNIPSGFFVDKYGRTSIVTTGLILCGAANFAISFIFLPGLGTPWLVFCRFLAGIGVSAFIAGGQMIISDISTHLNRTRTIAPVMASFSAGTALGPAIGGILVDTIGLTNTYAAVGGCFALIALNNQLTMQDTKRVKPVTSNTISTTEKPSFPSSATQKSTLSQEFFNSFRVASKSWKELVKDPNIKNMLILNGMFWFAMSGAQFTLLPLHLVSEHFHFTPFEIGSCFAYSSIVSFLASQPIAYLSDQYGKQKVMIGGMTFVSASVLSLPFTSNLYELLAILTPLSIGITSMNAASPALMQELTTPEQRAQGLSLLRTANDVGFIFGAMFSGLLASHFSVSAAFLTNGTTVLSSMIWFSLRSRLLRLEQEQQQQGQSQEEEKVKGK